MFAWSRNGGVTVVVAHGTNELRDEHAQGKPDRPLAENLRSLCRWEPAVAPAYGGAPEGAITPVSRRFQVAPASFVAIGNGSSWNEFGLLVARATSRSSDRLRTHRRAINGIDHPQGASRSRGLLLDVPS